MSYRFFEWKTNGLTGALKINSPPLNALSVDVLTEFDKVLDEIEKSEVRCYTFTGEGKAFIAGADITNMVRADEKEMLEFARLGHGVMNKIEKSKKISIAAVNGFALGGGLETALACDIRIFADSALAGLPETSLGIIPGFGGTQRLTKQVGPGHAKRLILSGEKISAQVAYELGVAQQVVAADSLAETAEKFANQVAANGPAALVAAKEAIQSATSIDLDLGLQKEVAAFAHLFSTGEPAKGMSAFLEKRRAEF